MLLLAACAAAMAAAGQRPDVDVALASLWSRLVADRPLKNGGVARLISDVERSGPAEANKAAKASASLEGPRDIMAVSV
jgi:hypothetical protein